MVLDLVDGIVILEIVLKDVDFECIMFFENFVCFVSGFIIFEIEFCLFFFNVFFGVCFDCDGFGKELFFDECFVVFDVMLKVYDGVLVLWWKGKLFYFLQMIEVFVKYYEFDKNILWKDFVLYVQQVFFYGFGNEEIDFCYDEGGWVYQVSCVFEGVILNMEWCYCEIDFNWICEEFECYQNNCFCGICEGYCLWLEVFVVKIVGKYVGQVVELLICEVLGWIEDVLNYLML